MDSYFTVRQAAQALAIKDGTLRLWLGQRRIPYLRCGRAIRISVQAVEDFISRNTVPARGDRR